MVPGWSRSGICSVDLVCRADSEAGEEVHFPIADGGVGGVGGGGSAEMSRACVPVEDMEQHVISTR